MLIGAVELRIFPDGKRELTGRGFVRVVRNRRRATIERLVRACVKPGTEVWTLVCGTALGVFRRWRSGRFAVVCFAFAFAFAAFAFA